MNQTFSKVLTFLKKLIPKRKITWVGSLFLLSIAFGIMFVWISPATALDFSLEGIANGIMMAVSEVALSLGEFCIRMTIFCLRFFIDLASFNQYVDNQMVMLGWTMVRDVANMFFVVIFLVIAIGTILGIEQYQWNKTLAKLVLGAVFINFSNLICGIFIDIAQVFTMTFVNAIAATAGGNLINMFHLNDMFTLTTGKGVTTSESTSSTAGVVAENMNLRLLSASIAAFLFAFLALVSMAAYTFVMLVRVVVLWVLIILSPIAFIAQAIPQGQSYASEWWTEFGKYVMVAPMMVFFLWLAFATAGDGQLAARLNLTTGKSGVAQEGEYTAEELGGDKEAVTMNKITSWANLSNLLIPIAILWVGLERVQKMGVKGGEMAGKASEGFKKMASYATGLTAAKWAGGQMKKAPSLAWKATKGLSEGIGFTDVLKRTGNKIQRWRVTTPYLQAIPILGAYGKLRREKLTKETEESLELARKNLTATIGRPENLSWRDKLGNYVSENTNGVFGFGMTHNKQVRYKQEEYDAEIQFEKGESKRKRMAEAKRKYIEKATKKQEASNEAGKEALDAAIDLNIHNEGLEEELGHVDEGDLARMEAIKIAEESIDKEAAEKLRNDFLATTDGGRAGNELSASLATRDQALAAFGNMSEDQRNKFIKENPNDEKVKNLTDAEEELAKKQATFDNGYTSFKSKNIDVLNNYKSSAVAAKAQKIKLNSDQIAVGMADAKLGDFYGKLNDEQKAKIDAERARLAEAAGLPNVASDHPDFEKRNGEAMKSLLKSGSLTLTGTEVDKEILKYGVVRSQANSSLDSVKKVREDRLKKKAAEDIKNEVEARIRSEYESGDGKRAKIELVEADQAVKKAEKVLESSFDPKNFADSFLEMKDDSEEVKRKAYAAAFDALPEEKKEELSGAIGGIDSEDDKMAAYTAEFGEDSVKVADTPYQKAQKSFANAFDRLTEEEKIKLARQFGSTKTDDDKAHALSLALQEGVLELDSGSDITKQLLLGFADTQKKDKAVVQYDEAVSVFKQKEALLKNGFEEFGSGLSSEKRASIEGAVIKEGGTAEERARKETAQTVAAENKKRHHEAEEVFWKSTAGKKYAKEDEVRMLDEINEYVKHGDGDGEDMQSRIAIAERRRAMIKGASANRAEEEVKAREGQAKASIKKSAFGEMQEIMELEAEQMLHAAEAFVEGLKNEQLTKRMAEAGKLIEMKLKAGGEKMGKAVELAYKKSAYVKAAEEQQKLEQKKEAQNQKQIALGELAKALKVEAPRYGATTPGTSLVPMAERISKDLKTMESQDSAAFAVKQISHLLSAKKKGEQIDDHQQAFLVGTAMHLGANGWFDDAISEAKAKITLLDQGKITDADEKEKIKALKETFVDELHILEKDGSGGYRASSHVGNVAALQNLMLSGANVSLTQSHQVANDVNNQIQKNGSATITAKDGSSVTLRKGINDSYEEIMRALGNAGKLAVGSFENFAEEIDKMQEYLQEASSFFKRNAITVGHQEYGAHQQFDSSSMGGKYRMAFQTEAAALMAAETRKFTDKVKWQYHGLGVADLDKGALMMVDSQSYLNQMSEVKTAVSTSRMADRTIDATTGYKFGESAKFNNKGQLLLGQSEEHIKETWGDVENFVENVLLKQVDGQAEALKFIARQKGGHVANIDADNGMARLAVAGTNISGEKYSAFLESMLEFLKKSKNGISVEKEAKLIAAIKASKEKELKLRAPKGGKEREEREREEYEQSQNSSS